MPQEFPFPDDYFQAFFCMQALHSFGTDPGVAIGAAMDAKNKRSPPEE